MPLLDGVIFDLDGTLVASELDFESIRREIGFVEGPILEFRENAAPEQRAHIDAVLERHETRAAETCALEDGAKELLDVLRERRVKVALLTRNPTQTVQTVMRRHGLLFDTIVAREDAVPKPSPEPVFLICRRLGIRPAHTLMVGDYKYDIECGANAGCPTVLVRTPLRSRFEASPDWEVDSLHDVIPIVKRLLEENEK